MRLIVATIVRTTDHNNCSNKGSAVEGFSPTPPRHPCLAPLSHGLSVPTNVSAMTRCLAVHQQDFGVHQQGFSGKYECTNVPKRVH